MEKIFTETFQSTFKIYKMKNTYPKRNNKFNFIQQLVKNTINLIFVDMCLVLLILYI